MFQQWTQVMRLLKSARVMDDTNAARLSHEVRQPLAAALAACHVLNRATDDERRHRAVAVLERELVRRL